MRQLFFRKEAIEGMLNGLDKVADAVSGTLGPKGLNVFIDSDIQPRITNDGATIAQNIFLKDKLESAGAYLIKNTSSQTNDDAGDGTTTTAVLAQALVHECLNYSENKTQIKDSLKEAGNQALKLLTKKSIKIKKEDIERVALISAENKELAKIISKIVGELGEKAVINVEDSRTFATEYEIVNGYEVNVGFISPYFINEKKSARAVFQDVPVLVSEKKISNLIDIQPLFEQFKTKNITSCVIVCDDMDDAMLGVFVNSRNLGTFQSVVIKAHGDDLKDIAGSTGATIISEAGGVNFQTITLEHLGKAKKVICSSNKTLFIGDGFSSKMYAATLNNSAENEPNMYIQKKIKERVAKLRGGIAVLRVGAATDFEREFFKMKAEDAVKASLAALEEGVVEGGGMAFLRIARELPEKTIGQKILKKVLISPFRKIIENAGKDYAEIIKNMPEDCGYDAKNDKYVKMVESGIIDPAKVARCALENAVSAASIFITTFAAIVNPPEKE